VCSIPDEATYFFFFNLPKPSSRTVANKYNKELDNFIYPTSWALFYNVNGVLAHEFKTLFD
jgi:hypothetical protein